MKLKLTKYVGITTFLLYKSKKKKPGEIQNFFIAKFWIFAYVFAKKSLFPGPAYFMT